MSAPTILLIGTADTKADELLFLQQCIEQGGARARVMDVGVLGSAPFPPAFTNAAVAAAAGTTLAALAALNDENAAMSAMARGAVAITLAEHAARRIDGVLALGGTMGTDLALDVTAALPIGMPKMVVSTVAFSHLIPPERLAPDLMMTLWAGGLYGLNSICRTILSQAAGAVLGACRTVTIAPTARPRVAIGSLGKSCLSYMVRLNPALEARGYEPVVFHCSGMGGTALEALIRAGQFVAVFDLTLQEVSNRTFGSVVNSGPQRLEAAGDCGVAQIVAPGASDMIDMQTWAPVPAAYRDRPYHAHNRLIASVTSTAEERRALARVVAAKLLRAKGPTAFLLPRAGLQAWDRPGEPLHDPAAHAAYMDAYRAALRPPVELIEVDAHINDVAFTDQALALFDRWVEAGHIPRGQPAAR